MDNDTCTVDGCTLDIAVVKRGLCKMHYDRWRKHGDVGPARKLVNRAAASETVRTCAVAGCEGRFKAKGFCGRHYENLRTTGDPLGSVERTPRQRLREVGWVITSRGCWEWRGNRNRHGYGRLSVNGKSRIVSRLMLSLHTPAPFEGAVSRHKCDNPPCVNPAHLEWGTVQDNSNDMVARRREQSYRADWWDGMCKNGLHDIKQPGAIHVSGGQSHCAECRRRK